MQCPMKNFFLDKNGVYRVKRTSSPVSYPKSGTSLCRSIETSSFWFSKRNEIILACIKKYPFRYSFLDAGGGNGYQTEYLKKHVPGEKSFYFLEPGYEGCLAAKKRGITPVFCGSLEDFPLEQHGIDAVGLFDVLEHVKDDKKLLTSLHKQLPEGGVVYITVPSSSFLWTDMDEYAGHYRRYTPSSLRLLASSSGFSVSYCSYIFSYLFLPVFLFRALPYFIGIRKKEHQLIQREKHIHRQPAFIRHVISFFHGWELRRIQNQKTMPFGTSCIAVLEKKKKTKKRLL